MNKINKALYEIEKVSSLSRRDTWLNNLFPPFKLITTVLYICLTVSFDKYEFLPLVSMALYPLVIFLLGELSFKDALYRLRVVLPVVCVIGIFNPFFDKAVITKIGSFYITGGMLSFITFMIKGVLSVFATYFLICSTTIEKLCYSLQRLFIPKIIVTEILLIYRYSFLFLDEVKKIALSYSLRAPGQKGVNFKVWGPLVGNVLLRAMERSQDVYDSMSLRGFKNDFSYEEVKTASFSDFTFFIIANAIFITLRAFPVFTIVGDFLLKTGGVK